MSMTYHVWLHRTALLAAACAFTLVIAGALTVSYGTASAATGFETAHRVLGVLTGVLVLILAAGVKGRLAAAAAIAVALQGAIGRLNLPVLHDVLGVATFALIVALALATSRDWIGGGAQIDPVLRKEVWWASALVGVQVVFGALVRNQVFGVVPHIVFATAVLALVMWVSLRVMMEYREQPAMLRSARVLITIGCSQVFLGMAAFGSRFVTAHVVGPHPYTISTTVAHVATGALTLAAVVVLAMLVSRRTGSAALPLMQAAS